MFGYSFHIIDTPDERERFKARYEASVATRSGGAITTSVDPTYLERCRVTGLYDRHGELVGGFLLNDHPPFLVLGTMPVNAREQWLARCPVGDQRELVGIWKTRAIPQAVSAFTLWPRIIRASSRRDRSVILGLGYDNRMNDIYSVAGPELVYAGLRADKPELDQRVHVYAYTPRTLVSTYAVNFIHEVVVKPPRRALARRRGHAHH